MRALWLVPLLLACAEPAAAEPPVAAVHTEPAFGGARFTKPVWAQQGPDAAWYVVEQVGRVQRLATLDATEPRLVLDITPKVNSGPTEAGLLGMAFHPKQPVAFLSYTTGSKPLVSRLSRVAWANGV